MLERISMAQDKQDAPDYQKVLGLEHKVDNLICQIICIFPCHGFAQFFGICVVMVYPSESGVFGRVWFGQMRVGSKGKSWWLVLSFGGEK